MHRSIHRFRFTTLLALVALVFVLTPAGVLAEEDAKDGGLPLKKVLLFSSGVGYFEHRVEVDGDARLDLTFAVDDVNDLLKSMVVQDLGGGHVSAVTYGSQDPVSKALRSFAIDLTANLTLSDLFQQVRGEKVSVEIGSPVNVLGTILSVETRTQRVKDDVLKVQYLNLLTEDGLRSITFDSIRSMRLLDERLDAEMREALAILSKGRDAQKKTVTLEFLGEGRRTVSVGYIQETPVWKTSYRLVLDEEGKPFLQGWAIVENTTDQDWDGVDLTLVSGRPISYTMNLYQPLYAVRPDVQPQVRQGVRPQTYEREMQSPAEEMEREGRAPMRRGRNADRRDAAPSRSAGRPGADKGFAADDLDMKRGVEAAATAAELGEMFQYHIAEPVHLGRQRSAMLPILNQAVAGEKVSIYDPSVHPKHPLNGLRLVNDTDLHITQGPVTVFDGGAYAGDAIVGDTPPGATRLLSYAMDLEVEIAQDGRSRPDEMLSVRVVKGSLITKHMRRRERIYVARNADRKDRRLLVSHPFDANWTLVAPAKPFEKTRNQYRFTLDVPAGKTTKLEIREEQTIRQEIGLSNLRNDRISMYLRAPKVSSRVKEALAELVRKKQAMDEKISLVRTKERRIKAIGDEQSRIRQNMGQIDRTSELYARYLKKFSTQEDEIEKLRAEVVTINEEVRRLSLALNAWLVSLNLD